MSHIATTRWALPALLACCFSALYGQPTPPLAGTVKIDGSSTVYPITAATAELFAEVQPKVEVSVGISGTAHRL
jgi:phosphate transport system substrate-binding protein